MAVDAADPARLTRAAISRGALASLDDTPLTVIAAGKGAWPMARAVCESAHASIVRGLIAGPRLSGSVPSPFEWFDAAHPVPDQQSLQAALRSLSLAAGVEEDGCLLVLLSGGASSMLAAPAGSLTLVDKRRAASALLAAGAPIDRLNCVRKHLSAIKGGRLAARAPRSMTLAISDVHGPVADDPCVIGSGPTVGDPTTFRQALHIVREAGEGIPVPVLAHLERGAAGHEAETIKPGDVRLARATYNVIGNRHAAMEEAMRAAQARGYVVHAIPDATAGEAREAVQRFIAEARWIADGAARPLCVLASGETTVHVRGQGRGGRNQEFALAAAPLIAGLGRAAVLGSAGTDGRDGPTDAAGAIVDSSTLERATRGGIEWRTALADNDAYAFFQPLGDLLMWSPTGANVGDVHVLLIA